MKKYNAQKVNDKSTWENFLVQKRPGTFLQSWNWGEVNRRIGNKIARLGFYKGNSLLGLAQLIHQPAKRGPHLLIPGGPVVDYSNKKLVRFVFSAIKKYSKKENVWFVRMRPDILDSSKYQELFKDMGFNSAPMHVHGENTLVLDLNKSDESILMSMRKNTRYLIRKSIKDGYTVTSSTEIGKIKHLYNLQEETVKRHNFIGFNKKLFRAELEIFSKDNQALLFECRKDSKLLASALIIFYAGKAFYHFSGSSDESRKTNASYYLQWQIIKKVKKMGMKYYDFWGVAKNNDPNHRFWGVTVFKRGFGGERINWMHAQDMIIHPFYWITFFFETLRRGIRRL
jgi:lipid II:glycine glycyltransferase (peptidoglycan interpeptide bridge formation enzyme)